MTDYTLFYWPLPFRGQFVRSVLAHVGASWTEATIEDLSTLKDADPTRQLVPHMGPPVLTDHDPAVDFSAYQTFTWIDANPLIRVATERPLSPLVQERLMNETRSALTRRGLRFEQDPARSDLAVAFTVVGPVPVVKVPPLTMLTWPSAEPAAWLK